MLQHMLPEPFSGLGLLGTGPGAHMVCPALYVAVPMSSYQLSDAVLCYLRT
jgi:hypothetical protein